jgi:aminobenzoyl-glutamate utilization protein B
MAKAMQREMSSKQDGLYTRVTPLVDAGSRGGEGGGSDDVAEVSWNVPTVVLRYPGNIPNMIGHHWSSGVAMATPIAHKGASVGAKAQALTALDILLKPEILKSAKQYFAEQTANTKWVSLIPEGVPPPIEVNRDKMEKVLPDLQKLRYDPGKYDNYLQQLGIHYPTVRTPGDTKAQ